MRLIALLCLSTAALVAAPERWVGAWSTATYDPGPLSVNNPVVRDGIANQTVRNIIHLSAGGRAIRVRLSNVWGDRPVRFEEVTVQGAAKKQAVSFGGLQAITILRGALALSDSVPLDVHAGEDLTISLVHRESLSGHVTIGGGSQTNFLIGPGDTEKKLSAWFFLEGLDVLSSDTIGAIVAFGDSITAGAASTQNANARWPDVLARRLREDGQAPKLSVLNAGIGGNRVLSNSPCFGENALARLARDVFGQTGVRAVILFEGTNDLGHPESKLEGRPPELRSCLASPRVTAEGMIEAYRQFIAQVHEKGLKVFGATILPYQGYPAWTQEAEDRREAINRWIMTSGSFDGTIDFSAAVADPANPHRLAPEKDGGDHLHPNDAGHKALADAIDLKLFQ
jgi:lysophospholipase L1-like esterase